MKTIFTITSFNTKEKQLCLLVRDSAEEAKMQIDNEINLLKKHEHILEVKIDYSSEETMLANNEHNAYCKTDEAEYYWKTDCVGFMENYA